MIWLYADFNTEITVLLTTKRHLPSKWHQGEHILTEFVFLWQTCALIFQVLLPQTRLQNFPTVAEKPVETGSVTWPCSCHEDTCRATSSTPSSSL